MGTLKDISDLTTQLINSIKDRKASAELRELQRMIGTFQSEQAVLHENRLSLQSENAELKKKVASLEQSLMKHKNNKADATKDTVTKLHQEQENILKFISEHDNTPENAVILNLKLSLQRAKHHFAELKELGFINITQFARKPIGAFPSQPNKWSITKYGRKYLFENNLLT